MRILSVGSPARSRSFSVIYNEDELLRNFGIEVTPYTSRNPGQGCAEDPRNPHRRGGGGRKEYAAKVDVSAMPIDKQRAPT